MISSMVGNAGRMLPACTGIRLLSSCPTWRYGSRTFWKEREISLVCPSASRSL